MQAYAETKNIKKKPVYISRVIYWSRKSGCVKKKNTKKQEQTRFITIYVKQEKIVII